MTEEPRKNTKSHLALAIAQGFSPAAWARANNVPTRTATRWSKDPLVRKTVDECRRRAIDRAIGKMTKHTSTAAEVVIMMAQEAHSESVRLRAARALFSDVITVSKYSGLEFRITEIETQIEQRANAGKNAAAKWSPTGHAYPANPVAKPPVTPTAPGPA